MIIGIAAAILGTLYMLFVCSSITKESFDKALSREIAREVESRH